MNIDIFNCIAQKKYNELNSFELAAISEFIENEEQYNQIKETLMLLEKSENDTIKPDDAIKMNLLEKFEKYNSKSHVKVVLLNRFLKYAAILVLVMLIGFVTFKYYNKSQTNFTFLNNRSNFKILKHTDIPALQIDTNSDTHISEFKNVANKEVIEKHQTNIAQLTEKKDTSVIIKVNASPKGISFKDDELLASILFVAL